MGDGFDVSPEEARGRVRGELSDLFFSHRGHQANKWVHYLPVYEALLGPLRGTPAGLLEIGVAAGGSLELWRAYLGPEAEVRGVDANPACGALPGVHVGNQGDPLFLGSVVGAMGSLDVVIDDGSHIASDQVASLRALWPHLANGGAYVIEDTHTSYWAQYDGGYQREGTAVETLKAVVDDLHGWFHGEHDRVGLDARRTVSSVTFFDSLAILRKGHHDRPVATQVGG